MSLKKLNLKKSYSSDFDDILYDFYIPVLEMSIEYNRLAGFFSSTSLAIAAKGILGLIQNKGFLKLIVSPKLNKKDLEIIIDSQDKRDKYIEDKMINELELLEDEFVRDHVYALGWMIANNLLEIKVAIVLDNKGRPLSYEDVQQRGIFHQKVGILHDSQGNKITFSGSVNETASGWLDNIEEFKVFRSWEKSEEDYVKSDVDKFNKFWDNNSSTVKVMKIPDAVKEKLIEIAPDDIEELNLKKWLIKKVIEKKKIIKLWNHQKQAIKKWVDNDKKGILEMATGTGKTFTALGCVEKIFEEKKKVIVIISCPYGHLVKQWSDDIDEFGINEDKIIADSSNYKWKSQLTDNILDIKNEVSDRLIVLTTHVTFSMNDFVMIIKKANVELFLIVDEVHGVGAPERKKGLLDKYNFRLGLSATPKRWFDIEGTDEIFNYFGNTVFEFPLEKAINTINPESGRTFLVPYEYKPYFIELTDDELYEYERETEKIAKAYSRSRVDKEKDKWFSLLIIRRQKIIKNAINKFNALIKILNNIKEINYCLIYCSPEQINHVQELLNSYNKQTIIQHKFTSKERIIPENRFDGISEREYLLKKFADGKYNVLVAMKCLDEGVDVPPAKIAIILANSGNPRQYIQRRGRVLRRFPGKDNAVIYDIIVIPTIYGYINTTLRELERKIIMKELKRYKEFAMIALNAVECLYKIEEIEEKYKIII